MKTGGRPVALLLAFSMVGCAAAHKPWSTGAFVGTIAGAVAGGSAGGLAAYNEAFGANDAENVRAGFLIGAGSGALVGALVGHLLFDEEAAPPPAPPPPPPPPAPTPPPPPPPVVLKGALFDFDQATIKPEAQAALDATVRSLKEHGELRVSIEGHTDSVGTDAYNMDLSRRRAEAVKAYLASQGISPERIEVKAFGESKPVADNATAAGRAENRRVEVRQLP